jgi:hypothetical protein
VQRMTVHMYMQDNRVAVVLLVAVASACVMVGGMLISSSVDLRVA